jgi:anthranilate phosphoribosyltransferase
MPSTDSPSARSASTADMPDRVRRPDASWAAVLATLLKGQDLTDAEAGWAMSEVIAGRATPAQLGGFLIGLRAKGETATEIGACVGALLDHAIPVTVPGRTVDIAGTGGDGTGAVNISTMAAVVAASTGVRVVKHGGRAASSSTAGSADLLEHLGIALQLTEVQAARAVTEVGITFLNAATFSPGLRHAAGVRRQLGVPTVFNVLGPLINPARPTHQVVGVAAASMAPVVADALAARGGSGLVVRGDDGLDNVTTTTSTRVWVVRDGVASASSVHPADLGLPRAEIADLRGGDAADNAQVVRTLLNGRSGPVRDVVLLNAAAVLVAEADSHGPLVDQLAAAMARCAQAIDTGSARTVLERWIAWCR